MKAQTNSNIRDNQLQRRLRKNPTDAEAALWRHLRAGQIEGCKFRRQHPFLDYVLDFVCLEKRVVVEVDGGQHLESEADRLRDRRLQEAGFQVLRFWNNQVLGEMVAVLEVVREALMGKPHPHPGPSRAGFAQPARSGGAEQCSAKPRLRPLEGEGEDAPLPPQGEGRDGGGVGVIEC